MVDDIFYGNVVGLLKRGRWNLSVAESSALIQILEEAESRFAISKNIPMVPKDPSPITQAPNKKSKKEIKT